MSEVSLSGANVVVLGGTGFLGRHLCEELFTRYKANVAVPTRDPASPTDYVDLVNPWSVDRMFAGVLKHWGRVDYVFHLAGYNGGVEFNRKYPADVFFLNSMMALNVVRACAEFGVKKLLSVVASCAYPESGLEEAADTDTSGEQVFYRRRRDVLAEGGFLDGPPHPSVACHAYAKRNLLLASRFFHEQYGLDAVCACPTTLYGPGDTFDPERSKVVGALVGRFVRAKRRGDPEAVFWGDGSAMREVMYVQDCAALLPRVMEKYTDRELPLNLGTGEEIPVKNMVEMVKTCVQYQGSVLWDVKKPSGAFRKRLELTRMRELFPDYTPTPFGVGLSETVDWFTENYPADSE